MGESEAWFQRVSQFAGEIASQLVLPAVTQFAVAQVRIMCEADGAALFLEDQTTHTLSSAPLESQAYSKSGSASRIVAPLTLGDQTLGIIEAVRGSARTPFAQTDQSRLELLAPHIAAAVHHTRIEASLREAREALQKSNQLLEMGVGEQTRLIARGKQEWEATFDAMQDPIVILEEFKVRRANRAFQALAQHRPWSEIIGSTCHQIIAGRATPCVGCPLKAPGTLSEVTLGEATFNARASAAQLGESLARVVHYRDVTEQHRLAERLRESERLASVGQLASGAAHEINNPLSFVVSNLRTLRDTLAEVVVPAANAHAQARTALEQGNLPMVTQALRSIHVQAADIADTLEIVDDAVLGAQRINEVVKSLRELSRQEQGAAEWIGVNRAVQRVVQRIFGPNPRVNLSLNATEPVQAVPNQFERALENVLRNALQATEGSGHVTVRAFDSEKGVVVEVEDTGPGIPNEHLAHIFDPFFTTRRVGEGMGLGLTVSWGIVKRFGGRIEVSSEEGKGTTFSLVFPPGAQAAVRAAPELQVGRYAERVRESGIFRAPSGVFRAT